MTDDAVNGDTENFIRNEFPWVTYLQGPGRGPAANRNHGARSAKGTWLVFTDDDCIPDQKWLSGFSNAIAGSPEIRVMEGKTYAKDAQRSLSDVAPLNTTGGFLWSCNMAIETNLFWKLGGFNEDFPYAAMEDVEFRTRLVKAGYDFLFVPEASLVHPWRSRGTWKKLKQHQSSTLIYLSIHRDATKEINSGYYLEKTVRQFLKITLPGIVRFKGKGIASALMEHISDLQMVLLLLFKRKETL